MDFSLFTDQHDVKFYIRTDPVSVGAAGCLATLGLNKLIMWKSGANCNVDKMRNRGILLQIPGI